MRKILIAIILLNMQVFAIRAVTNQEHEAFMKSLNLNKKQQTKIEQIEQEYSKTMTEINAQIILKNMEAAMLRNSSEYQKIRAINKEVEQLRKLQYVEYEQKDKDIIATLNWFQKRKYKEYISRVY